MTTRFLAFFLLATAALFAAKAVDPVRTDSEGLAIKGYDTVAYFEVGEPAEGSSEFEFEWMGAKWRFANADHLAKFKANPERYAPQYGGYCAFAVSRGKTAPISPKAWTVKNDKLYLNHPWAQGKFKKDLDNNISLADKNWPEIPKNSLP